MKLLTGFGRLRTFTIVLLVLTLVANPCAAAGPMRSVAALSDLAQAQGAMHLGMLAYGPGTEVSVSDIDGLIAALNDPGSGYTIKLEEDISDSEPRSIMKEVTLDMNGKTLSLAAAWFVRAGGALSLQGGGRIDAEQRLVADGGTIVSGVGGPVIGGQGVRVTAGAVTVAAVDAATPDYGGFAAAAIGGSLTVLGSVTASAEYMAAAYAEGSGSIQIAGSASGGNTGAYANGGSITITNNVAGSSVGVNAQNGGQVSVDGSASGGHTGVSANGGTITVAGDVTGSSLGAAAQNNGQVTIGGQLIAFNDYIDVQGVAKSSAGFELETTKAGYYTYRNPPSASVVWVKQPNHFTVNFSTGLGTPVASQTVPNGSKLDKTAIATTRTGFTFAGWYRTADCNLADFWDLDNDVTANFTLYAKWIRNDYTVSFNTGEGGTLVASQQVGYEQLATRPVPDPVRDGYTFAGWYRAARCDPDDVWDMEDDLVADNLTLYAKWLLNHTVAFHSHGGSPVDSQTVAEGRLVLRPADPVRPGHSLAGWCLAEDYLEAWNFAADPVNADITLHAQWTVNAYTVSFATGAGSAVASQSVDYGAYAGLPDDPTWKGHTFGGWFEDEACLNVWDFTDRPVHGHTTIFAKWTINQYTVSFNSRGGNAVASQTVLYNQPAPPPASPYRSGYDFKGWYRDESCTTRWNFANDRVSGDLTLYAGWAAEPEEPPTPPKPKVVVPTVSTDAASDLDLQMATLHGSVSASGGAPCTQVGFSYRVAGASGWFSTGVQATSITDSGSFSATLSDLKPNAAYEFRARAMNSAGWGEGSVQSFTTTVAKPAQVATLPAADLTLQGATLHGRVTDHLGVPVSEVGFRWGATGEAEQSAIAPLGDSFALQIGNLKPETTYSFQAYAVNPAGIAYGERQNFTTPKLVVETLAATAVSQTAATLNGRLTGAGQLLACGFAVHPDHDAAGITAQVAIDGSFSVSLSNLKPGVTYVYQAYADLLTGRLYAESAGKLDTLPDVPVVETNVVSAITKDSAQLAGTVVRNSGLPVTERGFLWGTDPKPSNRLAAGGDSRSFAATPKQLQRATTYYFQAYATNARGTGYGEVQSYTTLATLPEVLTGQPSSDGVTVWQAILSGSIVDHGGDLEQYGFAYQVEGASGWQELLVGSGVHSGQFVADLQAPPLTDQTKHYLVRAFARNSAGTAYGEILYIGRVPTVQSLLDEATTLANTVTLAGVLQQLTPGTEATTRGFQYRLAGDPNWQDISREHGSFAIDTRFNYQLTELVPAKEYEFRAVAQSAIGWGYGEIVRFATNYGKTAREIASNMRAAGQSVQAIANELITKLKSPLLDTVDALIFAGLGPVEAAAGLKLSRYWQYPGHDDINMARTVASCLKQDGVDSVGIARVYQQAYASDLRYSRSPSPDWRIAEELASLGFSDEAIALALQTVLQYSLSATASAMVRHQNGSKTESLLPTLGKVYGTEQLCRWLWNGPFPAALYLSPRNVEHFIRGLKLAGLGQSAEQIVAALQAEFPELTVKRAVAALAQNGYSLADTAAVLSVCFFLDPARVAAGLKQGGYPEDAIIDWLANTARASALTAAQVMRDNGWSQASTSIPAALIKYYSPDGSSLTKILYAAGWNEENYGYGIGGCGLREVIAVLLRDYGLSTPSQVIAVLRELGLSPLGVARMMLYTSALFGAASDTYFLKAYQEQGYSAADAAIWLDDVYQQHHLDPEGVIDLLFDHSDYTLPEVVLAWRSLYQLPAPETIERLTAANRSYRWGFTEQEISQAVERVYGADPYLLLCQTMKAAGAPAVQTASTLKDLLKATDMLPVAQYLIKVEYAPEQILPALADVLLYATRQAAKFGLLAALWPAAYPDSPEDLPLLFAAAAVENPAQAISVLHANQRQLDQITACLKQVYRLDILQAREQLVQSRLFQLAEILGSLERVYQVNPMIMLVQTLRQQGESAQAAVYYLQQKFGVNDQVELMRYLAEGGYSRFEALQTQVNVHQPTLAAMKLVRQLTMVAFPEQDELEQFVWRVFRAVDAESANQVMYNMSEYSLSERGRILHTLFGCDATQVLRLLHQFHHHESLLPVLRVVFPEQDALLVLLSYLIAEQHLASPQEGKLAVACQLLTQSGVTDFVEGFRYLRDLGFLDGAILDELVRHHGLPLPDLREFFPGQDPLQVLLSYRIAEQGRKLAAARELLTKSGITDIVEVFRYLRELGFPDDAILEELLGWSTRDEMYRVLREFFDTGTLAKFASFVLDHPVLAPHYAISHYAYDLPAQMAAAFPGSSVGDIALALRQARVPVDYVARPGDRVLSGPYASLVGWLRMQAHELHRDQSLASVLGPGQLYMPANRAHEILQSMGYSPLEVGQWLQKTQFPADEVLQGLALELHEASGGETGSLEIMQQLGYSLTEMFAAKVAFFQKTHLESASGPYWAVWYTLELGYSYKEVTRAYVASDCSLERLAEIFWLASNEQYDRDPAGCRDSGLYSGNHLSAKLLADYAYDAMEGKSLVEMARGFLLARPYYSTREILIAIRGVGSRYMTAMAVRQAQTGQLSEPVDSSTSNSAALSILRAAGLDIKEAVGALWDDGQEWMEALVILISAGYSGSDAVSAMWDHSSYHFTMGYAIIDLMSITIRLGLDPTMMKRISLLYNLASMGYKMGTAD